MKKIKVGGAVRDHFLGLKPNDIDLTVFDVNESELLAMGFRKELADRYPIYFSLNNNYEKYAIARDINGNTGKDITYKQFFETFDLTINAIGINLETNEVIDLYNGRQDIENKLLRKVHPNSFISDNIRILRAYRFYLRFNGFKFEEETHKELKNFVEFNDSLDFFRVKIEINKVLVMKDSNPSDYFKSLLIDGLLFKIMPWMKIGPNNFNQFLNKLDKSKDRKKFYWSKFKVNQENISSYYNILESLNPKYGNL